MFTTFKQESSIEKLSVEQKSIAYDLVRLKLLTNPQRFDKSHLRIKAMTAIKYRHYIPFPFKTIWIDELSKTLDLLRGKVSFRGLTSSNDISTQATIQSIIFYSIFLDMSYQPTEDSFLRKEKKSQTTYVHWCGDPNRQSSPCLQPRPASKSRKISVKQIIKKKEGVKNQSTYPKHKEPQEQSAQQPIAFSSQPKVSFHYAQGSTPMVSIVHWTQIHLNPACSYHSQQTNLSIQSKGQDQKDKLYSSYLSPTAYTIHVPSEKIEHSLAKITPAPQSHINDDLKSQVTTNIKMNSSRVSIQQPILPNCTSQKQVREIFDQSYQQIALANPLKESQEEQSVEQKKEEEDRVKQDPSLLWSFGQTSLRLGGSKKLQRRKYEQGKFFNRMRKIDTIFSFEDGDSESSQESRVLQNYQGIMKKLQERTFCDQASERLTF